MIAIRHLINWVGGKRLLRKTIKPLIPDDIKSYIEPFGGAAWILFYQDKWAEIEVYNDLDSRLYNLFQIVKYHPEALQNELKFMIASRELFLESLKNPGFTDIQRAARFMFLISRSFGGKGTNFGTAKKGDGGGAKSHHNLINRVEGIHKRLDKVLIENQDFEKLITSYDHEGAFFYCDPPYTSGAGYITTSTKDFEHERLHETLKSLKGRFLLSYDNSIKVKEMYKNYDIIEVERQKGLNNRNPKGNIYKELIIKNY